MLVLSRHRGESIIIGDDIVITVVDVRGDKVRLGIAAPTEVPVHRREVYEAIRRERPESPTAPGKRPVVPSTQESPPCPSPASTPPSARSAT